MSKFPASRRFRKIRGITMKVNLGGLYLSCLQQQQPFLTLYKNVHTIFVTIVTC